jgi:hypothetical protein
MEPFKRLKPDCSEVRNRPGFQGRRISIGVVFRIESAESISRCDYWSAHPLEIGALPRSTSTRSVIWMCSDLAMELPMGSRLPG